MDGGASTVIDELPKHIHDRLRSELIEIRDPYISLATHKSGIEGEAPTHEAVSYQDRQY